MDLNDSDKDGIAMIGSDAEYTEKLSDSNNDGFDNEDDLPVTEIKQRILDRQHQLAKVWYVEDNSS